MISTLQKVKTVLPEPFDWSYIPEGKVTIEGAKSWDDIESYIPLGKNQEYAVNAFYLAKYPITNAQFAKFIEAEGYKRERFWTQGAWEYLQKAQRKKPYFWDDKLYNDFNQPVVGVSWYEALAFCKWLTEIVGETGKTSIITLPTEQQWLRAAQGDDKRSFPWGNDFDINN